MVSATLIPNRVYAWIHQKPEILAVKLANKHETL